MSTKDGSKSAEAVSLYLDLEPGSKADLEVIARASLAFAAAIREVAYAVDPSLELRIELLSGTESSLSLNGRLTAKVKTKLTRLSLAAVAFGTINWFTQHTLDFIYEHTLESVFRHESSSGCGPEEVEHIVKKAVDAYRTQAASKVQEVYRELQADPAISGVGTIRTPGGKPEAIVPKREFAMRALSSPSGYHLFQEDGRTRRERINIETVTLVVPVLMESRRQWRFVGKEGEFGAKIKDAQFLNDLLHGRSAIRMTAGIRMEVELQTIEDPISDGAWRIKERNILQVRRVNAPPIQGNLELSTSHAQQTKNSHDEQDN